MSSVIKKKKIVGIITSSENPEQDFHLFNNLYKEMGKSLNQVWYINIFYLKNKFKKIKKFKYPKNFKIFEPTNISKLIFFLKNKKLISFVNLEKQFNNLIFYLIFKKYDVKLLLNLSTGDYQNKNFFLKKTLKSFYKYFKFILFNKIPIPIFNLLTLFNLVPKYEIVFTASKEEELFLNKKKNNFGFFDLKSIHFNRIIRVNFRAYDIYQKLKKFQKKKYLVFLDSGFDHEDVISQEGKHTENNRKKYYQLLVMTLKKLEKLYKKNFIICLHPKTNKQLVQNYIKDIKITQFETQKYISKAHLVVFHESSSVLDAIILQKKIINLQGNIMGKYFENRNKYYSSKIKIPTIKLEENNLINKNNIEKFFKNKKFLYKKYISNFLIFNFSNLKKQQNKNHYKFLPGYKQILLNIKKLI